MKAFSPAAARLFAEIDADAQISLLNMIAATWMIRSPDGRTAAMGGKRWPSVAGLLATTEQRRALRRLQRKRRARGERFQPNESR